MSILIAGLITYLLISAILVLSHLGWDIATLVFPLRRLDRRRKIRVVFKPLTKAKKRGAKDLSRFWNRPGQRATLPGTTRAGSVCWTTGMNRAECRCATCGGQDTDDEEDDDDYDYDIE